jgi:hypothetical protein
MPDGYSLVPDRVIGVICARNPGRRNLGMYSVDLSAARYFSSRGLPYRLLTYSGHRRNGDLRYEIIPDPGAYNNYREIVFWGDFQQHPIWGIRNHAPRLAKERRISLAEGLNEWKKRFLLSEIPAADVPRYYSIGTCFLGLQAALSRAGLTTAEYANLLSRFSAIVPRDDASYRELSALGLTNLLRGFDCASLLDHPRTSAPPPGRFAYAFGRTMTPGMGKQLVENIARTLQLQAVPITWLLGKYRLKNLSRRYDHVLETLHAVEFLVTDIYHLTVNALNSGCPVYCIGRDGKLFDDTCDDYKKVVLMEMLDYGEQYLVLPEATADPAGHLARDLLQRRQAGASPQSSFSARKESFRATLDKLWIAG